jgi:hypothetical protein
MGGEIKISRRTVLAMPFGLFAAGCGYSVRPPYDATIRTVYVPIFRNITFQRDIHLQVTEAVQKEIPKRTPYKVVGSPDGADTTLEGSIVYMSKIALVENPNNLARQIQGTINAQVRWLDNRSGGEKSQEMAPVVVIENAQYFPELGETSQQGLQKGIIRMAKQIVDMMEEPWYLPNEPRPDPNDPEVETT